MNEHPSFSCILVNYSDTISDLCSCHTSSFLETAWGYSGLPVLRASPLTVGARYFSYVILFPKGPCTGDLAMFYSTYVPICRGICGGIHQPASCLSEKTGYLHGTVFHRFPHVEVTEPGSFSPSLGPTSPSKRKVGLQIVAKLMLITWLTIDYSINIYIYNVSICICIYIM